MERNDENYCMLFLKHTCNWFVRQVINVYCFIICRNSTSKECDNNESVNIEAFLEEYSDILLEDHKELILEYYNFLITYTNEVKKSSKFGNHYISCPWSSDTTSSGPDTCACYYVDSYKEKLAKLVNWYKKFVNK